MIIKKFLFIFLFLFYIRNVYAISEGDIVINEIISNPADGESEAIELFNETNNEIILDGFSLEDATANPFYLDDFIIEANGFIFFTQGEDFSFVLNNSSETLKLKYNDLLIDIVEYGTSEIPFPEKGESLCRDDENFFITEDNTLGFENIVNSSEDEDSSDSSDSSTPDSSEEENNKKNLIKGNIIVSEYFPFSLENDEFIELFNKSNNHIDISGFYIKNSISSYYFDDIILNPNDYLTIYRKDFLFPLLNDKDFLKIYDKKDNLIFNFDYKNPLKDFSYIFDKNSKKYIPTQISTPGSENILKKQEEFPIIICDFPEKFQKGLAFNFNCSDSYSLTDNNLDIEVSWGNKKSSSFDNYIMFLKEGTKEINVTLKTSSLLSSFSKFFIDICDTSDLKDKEKDLENKIIKKDDLILSTEESSENILDDNLENFIEVLNISDFSDLEKDDYIKYCGIVTSLPSDISDKYFYIEGAQIYNNNSNFIPLELSDYICVYGDFSTYYSENRIKISDISDISFLNKANINILKIDELEDLNKNIGNLVEVSGVITNKKSYKVILESNFGNQYDIQLLSDNISSSDFVKDKKYKILGILSLRNSNFRIIPRYIEDIAPIEEEKLDKSLENNNLESSNLEELEEDFLVGEDNNLVEEIFIENESKEVLLDQNNKQKILIFISSFLFLSVLILIIFKIKKNIKK
ncbi:lamin tail domain-containing protein [Patescibacteria group bacterium]|nr:lamin tail domain-containing protein [Patescibacteria group bacterium]